MFIHSFIKTAVFIQAIVPNVGGPDNNKQDPFLQSMGEMDVFSPNYNPKCDMKGIMGEL